MRSCLECLGVTVGGMHHGWRRGWRWLGIFLVLVGAGCGDDGVHHLADAPLAPDTPAEADATLIDAPEVVGPVTCGASVQLDTAGNAVSTVRTVTLPAGRFVVAWDEYPATAPVVAKLRVFDRTQYLPEQAQATPPATRVAALAADDQGVAYAAWPAGATSGRAVLAAGAPAFGTATTFAQTTPNLAGLASGAVLMYLGAGASGLPSPTVSIYSPATTSWSAPQVLLDGNFRDEALATSVVTGKAAASWVDTFATGSPLYVSVFDGAAWSTPVFRLMTPTGSGESLLGHTSVVLAGGDVVLLFVVTNQTSGLRAMRSVRFHAATSTFDPPVPVDPDVATAPSWVFVDAQDRITVVYTKGASMFAARELGAGWTTAVDLGVAVGVVAAIDPVGSLAVVLQPATQSGVSTLRRLAASGTTWTDPVPTGFGPTNGAPEKTIALAFDLAHRPVVIAKQIVGAQVELRATVCQ